MRTTVIAAVAIVSTFAVHAGAADAASGRQKRAGRVRSAIARHTPPAVKRTVDKGFARLARARHARAERRERNRGRALADVHLHGRTRIRTVGDLLWSPALHGVVVFAGMLAMSSKPTMALLAGGLVYASSRSAKKTSDGWLRLENRSIDVLEREGPEKAADRFSDMGSRDPAASVKTLQKNRHLRNGSYPDQ